MKTENKYTKSPKKKTIEGVEKKMKKEQTKTLKEQAQQYENTDTKNIADLDKFDWNMTLHTYKGETTDDDGNPKKFAYKYLEDKHGTRYRVPWTVIGQLKDFVEENPEHNYYKVKKTGSGMKTRYTVMPVPE